MATEILRKPDPILKWNMRQLYWDILWFGILAGSTVAFLSIYAARLGASGYQIGLLSAGPAIINLIFTLPSGNWIEGKSLIRISFKSSIWQRLGYLVLVALPWFFRSNEGQVWGIIWITLVMAVAGTVLAISFNVAFAEVVPPEWRAHAVGRRNILLAITITISTLISGQILDRIIFPYNYQIVFLIGAVGAFLSSYHLGRIRPIKPNLQTINPGQADSIPAQEAAIALLAAAAAVEVDSSAVNLSLPSVEAVLAHVEQQALSTPTIASAVEPGAASAVHSAPRKAFLRLDLLKGPFGLFMVAYLAFYTFQFFPIPLFPLAYVDKLNLTDGMLGIGNALFYGTMMLGSFRLTYLSNRYGHRRLLWISAALFPVYPLFLAMAKGPDLYYVACITGGLVFGVLNAAIINRLMERVPADDRPAHMAIHNLALNLGILAGSLLGPVFANLIGLDASLYLSAFLRLLSGGFFLLWG